MAVGINHESAPVITREQTSILPNNLDTALDKFKSYCTSGVILSTCNRTEIYVSTSTPKETSQAIYQFFSEFSDTDINVIRNHSINLTDTDAIDHLFQVTSGLKSMVIGETEILGQVRRAMIASSEKQMLSPELSRLFHKAIQTGRLVRHQTGISHKLPSISALSIDMITSVLGDSKKIAILVIGTGEAANLVTEYAIKKGYSGLTIASKYKKRVKELNNNSSRNKVIHTEEIYGKINTFDVIISATETDKFIINNNSLPMITHPLHIIDISMPRSIDPKIHSAQISLFNIDDITSLLQKNIEHQNSAIAEAKMLIQTKVSDFSQWWSSIESISIIKYLREESEKIRRKEVNHALKLLPGLSEKDQNIINTMSQSIINKILHHPTTKIKNKLNSSDIDLLKKIFETD